MWNGNEGTFLQPSIHCFVDNFLEKGLDSQNSLELNLILQWSLEIHKICQFYIKNGIEKLLCLWRKISLLTA